MFKIILIQYNRNNLIIIKVIDNLIDYIKNGGIMKLNEHFATILSLENEIEDLSEQKIPVKHQKYVLKKMRKSFVKNFNLQEINYDRN